MLGAELAAHWLGYHRLTGRYLAAFLGDRLVTFMPAAPLRPLSSMLWEVHGQTAYVLGRLVTGAWPEPRWPELPSSHPADLRAVCSVQAARLARELPGVPDTRYLEVQRTGWGEMTGRAAALGALGNQSHHRAQGAVYLRELGLEPPDFWDRQGSPA